MCETGAAFSSARGMPRVGAAKGRKQFFFEKKNQKTLVRWLARARRRRVKSPLAVVTMVYNEPDFLPVWAAHYRAAVGTQHCYVIDHGSDDGSIDASGPFNLARLERSPLDEAWRADLVSRLCADLLHRYDAVAYTDVDELLVADPRRFKNLADLSKAAEADVVTAFGADVLEVPGDAPIDFAQPITTQRRWTRPFSSLFKPALTRRPVRWSPGFHHADAPSHFGGLYLFHIAYVDHAITARRQAKRQLVPRSPGHGMHHDVAPDEMVRLIKAGAELPRDPYWALGSTAETRFIAALLRDGQHTPNGRVVAADRNSPVLWAIPDWLDGAF
jgi:hypothetical protein